MDAPVPLPGDRTQARRVRLAFDLLCLLEQEPGIPQREMAARLDTSLGRVNLALQALCSTGALEAVDRYSESSRTAHAYHVTPTGVAWRSALTDHFITSKQAEVEQLSAQISRLQGDGA